MADEKRFQVFVSSTYTDLAAERAAVIQAILRMDHLPAGMEMFPSADESQWELIEQVIDQSDYYVVVVAGRYGSIIDAEGISYTEKEYDYAVKSGIPVLGFVHKNPGQILASNTDLDKTAQELLDKFRDKVKSKPVNFFESPAELGGLVVTSLMQAIKKKPGIGWVRGDKAMTVEQEREIVSLREQIATLREQKAEAESALVEDVADLAQGDQRVTISVLSQSSISGRDDVEFVAVATTWDEIFADVGPLLVDESPEHEAEKRLATHLYHRASDEEKQTLDSVYYGKIGMPYDDWDIVKTQFRALGLIDKGQKKRPIQDKNKYLSLTDRGDRHLTQLLAVKSGVDPGKVDDSENDDSEY
ncbi:DUF4062 domain-containing protein [Gordonia soli]|uniref:DUF4062 domain-containing protein n=1 Tax=Gordonia soli NBRC 108243 TaxID=1223545 RepID=M0QMQ7_9ACTN|nr:DUF4062 domain-containing protein [Gordonia soli]GAC69925.1 hypothetical protein GS4_29_00240 [Gordonia soli NBRC 108243]